MKHTYSLNVFEAVQCHVSFGRSPYIAVPSPAPGPGWTNLSQYSDVYSHMHITPPTQAHQKKSFWVRAEKRVKKAVSDTWRGGVGVRVVCTHLHVRVHCVCFDALDLSLSRNFATKHVSVYLQAT